MRLGAIPIQMVSEIRPFRDNSLLRVGRDRNAIGPFEDRAGVRYHNGGRSLRTEFTEAGDFEVDNQNKSIRFRSPVCIDGDPAQGKSLYLLLNKGEGGGTDISLLVTADSEYRPFSGRFPLRVDRDRIAEVRTGRGSGHIYPSSGLRTPQPFTPVATCV